LAGANAVVISCIVVYATRIFPGQYARGLEQSLTVTASWLKGWAALRREQAALLARLINVPSQSSSVRPTTDSVLRAFVDQGGYESARLLARDQRLVAIVRQRESNPESPAHIDFTAPITSAGDTIGWVVLRSAIDDRGFSDLSAGSNDDYPDVPTRTSAVILLPPGDSAATVVLDPSSSRLPSARLSAVNTLSAPIRDAIAGKQSRGISDGLGGSRVLYAAAPVAGLPAAVIKEHDFRGLPKLLKRALWINAGFITLLFALIALAFVGRWRTAHLRRENELAQLRSNFVSSVSHELRTPLTQIRMYAELLRKGVLPQPAEGERALRVIEKESERLTVLVEKVLNFTRLRRTLRRVDAPPIEIADSVARATDALAHLCAERDVRVSVTLAEGTCARIDPEELHQVLLNLLENAVKYGPPGQTITIGALEDPQRTEIWVQDQGPGVPPSEHESIWGAFSRGSNAEQSGETGSGIGLAIVREIALQYGGRAFVESGPNGRGASGARFVVELPSSHATSPYG
jgi:signal transduction histidine kinase